MSRFRSAEVVAKFRHVIWFLLRIAREQPATAIAWLVMALLGGMLVPAQLWAGKGVVDNLQDRIDGGAGSSLWWYAAIWVGAMGVVLITEQVEGIFAATAQERGGSAISEATLLKATRIDLASFENQEFYDRFSLVLIDAEAKARETLTEAIRLGWVIPRLTAWLAILIVFDWRLALLGTAPLIPAIWVWFFSGAIYWSAYQEQTRDRRLAAYYARLVTDRTAAREVRLFGLANTFIERWEALYWSTAKELRGKGLRIAMRQRGMTILSACALMFGFAWFVGTNDREITAGTALIVVASYMSVFGSIFAVAGSVTTLGKSAGFASDLREFLSMPEEGDARHGSFPPDTLKGELRLETVSFSYPDTTKPVIDNVSLTIRSGATIALVGENGAGKTTLVKLMLGLFQPDTGRVLLDEVDISSLDPEQLRTHFSGVFQHFVRYPLTVAENVAVGATRSNDDIVRALKLAGLYASVERLPDGVNTVLAPDLGGVDLSGGQWQRIAIARASTRDAVVLCLDEPTAALDPMAEVAIFQRFAELSRDRTTMLVSHRLGMARLADRIIVLEHGRIVEQGSHDELVARIDSEYSRMWQAQSRWYQ